MALSNKFGWLVLTTGNKSETSVGYATLYGDMVGGFALLKDVLKTHVFRLARRLNECAGPRADPAVDHRAAAGPSCVPTSSTTSRCRRTRCSTRSSRRTSSSTARARSSQTVRPGVVVRAARADRPRRVQAPPGAARREAPPAGLRPGPADADHEPLAGLNAPPPSWSRLHSRTPPPSAAAPRLVSDLKSDTEVRSGVYPVICASASTVHQLRIVTVVGLPGFTSVSISFERAWPFGTLT